MKLFDFLYPENLLFAKVLRFTMFYADDRQKHFADPALGEPQGGGGLDCPRLGFEISNSIDFRQRNYGFHGSRENCRNMIFPADDGMRFFQLGGDF